MPRYAYHCEKCKTSFTIVHSIKGKLTDCKKCTTKESLKRIPYMPAVIQKNKKAGKLVDKHIEETKKEVEEEKKKLKKVEYK